MTFKLTYAFAKEHCSYMSSRIMDKLKTVESFTLEQFQEWFPEDSNNAIGLTYQALKSQGKKKEARKLLYKLLERDCPKVYGEANPGKPNVVQDVMDALIAEPFDKEKLALAALAAWAARDAGDAGAALAALAAWAARDAGDAGAAWAARAARAALAAGDAIKKFQFALSIEFFRMHLSLSIAKEETFPGEGIQEENIPKTIAPNPKDTSLQDDASKKLRFKIIVKNKLNELEDKICTLENYEYDSLQACLTYLASQSFRSEDKNFKSLEIIKIDSNNQ